MRPIVLAAAAFVLGLPARALAANVAWKAPPSCGNHASVVEAAERLLGRPLDSVDSVDFEVVVTEAGSEHWTLSLYAIERFTGERREREFSGKTCAEVTDAVAVAMAMAVDSGGQEPGATSRAAEPSNEAPSGNPSTVEPARRRAERPSRTNAERAGSRLGLALDAAIVADTGALPSVAPGIDVGASLTYRALRVTAFAEAFLSQETRESDGRGGEFELLVGGLLGCGRGAIARTWVFGCLGVEAGRLSGTGVGARTVRSGESPWWAPRADLGAVVPLVGRLSLLARIGATLPVIRSEFVLDDMITVHRPAAVTGRALIGAEFDFE